MALFKFLRRRTGIEPEPPRVGGKLAYYGLGDWWLHVLSEEDRQAICARYRTVGAGRTTHLSVGNVESLGESALAFLTNLAGNFKATDVRSIAYKLLARANELVGDSSLVLDVHYFHQMVAEINFLDRDDPDRLAASLRACHAQVAISKAAADALVEEEGVPLPTHYGFDRLTSINHALDEPAQAIAMIERATAEGWNGPWVKRLNDLRARS
jgi:hypothetical protein